MNNGTQEREWMAGEGQRPRYCTCPVCGYEIPALPQIPCYTMRCPRCEAPLR